MESLKVMPVRIKVTAIIKKAILSGEYEKGAELRLTDVAETLGVSRTPVREAFQALEAEGLLELRMNRGAIVKGIDEKFIRDHYEMRILLESEAARRAAERTLFVDDMLKELEEVRANLSDVKKDYYEDLNQRIHMAIWKAADNQKLYSYLLNLWNGPSIGRTTSVIDHYRASTEEHIEVLEAIKNHDAEKAKDIMDKHIRRSMDNILAGFSPFH